ncbi:RrF2 family transcriptional regulator [Polynucleobacter necessarius]|uniref:RrF2 family transcriptional regulator n=1 Tax=Polynucleobacter necessarius TaxID=576610 RepID=UPI000E0906AB|nr:Rrf2 family transcriptional regulator [Polynucleobacter necessarius]
MEVTKAVKAALNTLVDIASHSANGRLVSVPEISNRLHLSISRIELLLRPLRESGLVIGIKGRAGGYQLSKEPRMITIKDIVLAMNRIKKRKVEASDIAKDLYQTLETYMMTCISSVNLTTTIKNYIPRFSEMQEAPERNSYLTFDAQMSPQEDKSPKGEMQKVLRSSFKKAEEAPRGPNSVFSFADYLNKNSSTN